MKFIFLFLFDFFLLIFLLLLLLFFLFSFSSILSQSLPLFVRGFIYSRRTAFSIGFSVAAIAAVLLLASSSSPDTTSSNELSENTVGYSSGALRSQLDGEEADAPADGSEPVTDGAAPAAPGSDVESADKLIPPALQGFVPHVDKIKFPTSWSAIRKTFGSHLDWAFILAFLGLLTWAYVRYVRPKLPKPEGETMVLDENDVTASLHLVPGEELFFHDCETAMEGHVGIVQYFGGSNRVSKIAITNKRVVAQFREATFCGTCQVSFKRVCAWRSED
jgi:hypothetical protein